MDDNIDKKVSEKRPNTDSYQSFLDDNIDKKVSEKRPNTDSYQSFLDELGINSHRFTGVSFLY